MDLNNLQTLVAIAEHGSAAAAARSLHTSVGTLRRRMSEFEAEVGAPLVRRKGRRLALTPAGQVLASGGRQLIADSRAVLERVTNHGSAVTGEYYIATPVGMPPRLSAMIVAGHLASFPGVRLRPLPVASPIALLPDQADIAVTFEPCPTDGPWLTAVIRRANEIVMASREYLARHGAPSCVDELHDHVLLSWIPPGQSADEWPLWDGTTVSVRTQLSSPDILLLRHCMLAGIGLARVPDDQVPDFGFPPGAAVPVLSEVLGRELVLRVVMPDTPRMRVPFRHFFRSIRDQVQAV